MTPSVGPDSDHLPYAWLKDRLDNIERRMADHNSAMRADMSVGFSDLRRTLSEHEADDNALAMRVTIIETQREEESKQAMRGGVWAGIFAAGSLTAVWEVFKRTVLGWHA